MRKVLLLQPISIFLLTLVSDRGKCDVAVMGVTLERVAFSSSFLFPSLFVVLPFPYNKKLPSIMITMI